MKHFGVKS